MMMFSSKAKRVKLWQHTIALCCVLMGGLCTVAGAGDVHTFSGPNGTTLEAEVLDFVDGKVVIRRVADRQQFELPANRLAPADVEFMKAWLKEREASAHPLGWKTVRIHVPMFADEVEAPGIPAAFRRTDVHTWEAELPEGAWILVSIFRQDDEKFSPAFLLPYDGQREWFLSYENNRLSRSTEPQGRTELVGLFVASKDEAAVIRAIKGEVPEQGIALTSEFLSPEDFSALGGKAISAVVGEIAGFSVASDAKLRALRMDDVMRESTGLGGWDELEMLDVRCSGSWPFAECASLEALTTLIVDGDVTLGAAIKEGAYPALKHLSLVDAEIDDPDSFRDFAAQLGELNSLTLPDDYPLHLGGLTSCPNLTTLDLGSECGDPGTTALATMKSLTTLLMKRNYRPADLEPLINDGHFDKLRTLRDYQGLPFANFPQLRDLHVKGNEDEGVDLGSLELPENVTHLRVRNPNPADLTALGAIGAGLKIEALTLTYPSVADVGALATLPSLAWLTIEDQLATLDQKMEALDSSALPYLRGLSLLRLQNLTSLKPAGPLLEALSVRSCSELKRVDPSADKLSDKIILKN